MLRGLQMSELSSPDNHIIPPDIISGNWTDISYIMPTGPESCDIIFDWYFDKDVYTKMRKGDRAVLLEMGVHKR